MVYPSGMNKAIVLELVEVLEGLLAECKASARKVDALEKLIQEQTPYSVGYTHALGRVADRAGLEAVAASLAALRKSLPQNL